jgi:hypothetical protein
VLKMVNKPESSHIDTVTRFQDNEWAAMVGLVEVVVAGQQGKSVCTQQQHATVGQAVLSVLSALESYKRG